MAILEKWQNKQYNKRLETALKNIDEHFHVNTQYGFYLEYCFYGSEERSFKYNDRWIYIDTYRHCVRCLTKSSINDKTICENITEQVLNTAKQYQQQYEILNNQLFRLDEYLQKMDSIVKEYNDFIENIDCNIRNEFDMNLTTR